MEDFEIGVKGRGGAGGKTPVFHILFAVFGLLPGGSLKRKGPRDVFKARNGPSFEKVLSGCLRASLFVSWSGKDGVEELKCCSSSFFVFRGR